MIKKVYQHSSSFDNKTPATLANKTGKKQGNHWKRGMLPKCLLSIKGRSCNQTPPVHQDMPKKTTFYKK